MRRVLIGLFMLAAVLAAVWVGYTYFEQSATAAQPQYETITAVRGTIASTVSATGSFQPEAESTISFRSPGRVVDVLVSPGEHVSRGQILATLDSSDLAVAVAQARVNLEISQAQLAKLVAEPNERDIAAAESAVTLAEAGVRQAQSALNSAQASYNKLLAGPSETERTVNLAQVRQAEANVRRAQQAYDQVANMPNVGALPQALELEQATLSLELARAQAALTDSPPDNAAVAAAQSQIAQAEFALRQAESNVLTAQKNLDDLLAGPRTEDVEIARAQVRQAQLSQLQSESNLSHAQLVAPIDGVVSQVNVRQGELSNTGRPDLILTDLDRFHMKVLVDEIDVRQVQLDQPVQIRIDALPDTELEGRITQIAPTANDVGGVVAYEVTVVANETDAPLRPGMSATAIITTAEAQDAILLPNRYIQLDRETGQAFVFRVVDGEPVRHEVQLGLRNERSSQIVSGLAVGDGVALVTQSSQDQLRNAIFGGN
jgi:HlyD family secretion protein